MQRADLGHKPSEGRQECAYLCKDACHVCSSSGRAQSLNCHLWRKERLFALTANNLKVDSRLFKNKFSDLSKTVLVLKKSCFARIAVVGFSIFAVTAFFRSICIAFFASVAMSAGAVVYAAEQELNAEDVSNLPVSSSVYSKAPDSTLFIAEANNTPNVNASKAGVDGIALKDTNEALISTVQDQSWMNNALALKNDEQLLDDEQSLMNDELSLTDDEQAKKPAFAESSQNSEQHVEISDAASQKADNRVLLIKDSEILSNSLSTQSKVMQTVNVQEKSEQSEEVSLALGFGSSMITPIQKLFPSSIEHNSLGSPQKTVENRNRLPKPNFSSTGYKEPLVMNVAGHSLVMGDGTELSNDEDFSYIKRIINTNPLQLSKDTCYYFKTYADAQIAPDEALIKHLSKVHNLDFGNFALHMHSLVDKDSYNSNNGADTSSNAKDASVLSLNHSRYLDPSIGSSNARYVRSVLKAAELDSTFSLETNDCSLGGYFVKNGKNAEKCREQQLKKDLVSNYQMQLELERILHLKGDNKSLALRRAQAISDYEHHDSEKAALMATGKTPLKDYMSQEELKPNDYSFRALGTYVLSHSYYNERSQKATKGSEVLLDSYFESANKVQPRIFKDEVIIGFSAVHFANPWYKDIVRGMNIACKDLDIKCVVVDAKGSEYKQAQDIEKMLQENYNAIISVPINSELIAPLYKQAQTKGIVTGSLVDIVPHSDLEYELLDYDYGYSIGEQAAQWASKHLKCNATVVVLSQDNIEASIIRGDGIIDALYDKCPNLDIVTRALSATPQQGQTVIANLLKSYPDLNMVVASTDAAGIGAYQAMVQAHATGADRAVFSGDATLEALSLLKDKHNIFRGTVKLSPIRTGYESIKRMHDLMQDDKHLSPLREFMPFIAVSKEEYLTTLSLFK